jgi:hypothetical protein
MERRSHSLTSSGKTPDLVRLPAGPSAEHPDSPAVPAQSPPAEPAAAESADAQSPPAEPAAAESADVQSTDAQSPDPESTSAEHGDQLDDTVVFATPILPPEPPPANLGRKRAAKPPPWAGVLATTFRLWVQRRLRRRPRPRRAGWRWVVALTLVAAVFGAGAITVALIRKPAPAGSGQGGSGALGAAATVRTQAAAWVASQVSADAIVACDPAMCAVLQGNGIPASRLLMLASGNADPLGSDVIMATAAVRSQFGSRLADVYAPVTLSSFGHGSAQIIIRAVAPDGAAAYLAALRADLLARMTAGRQLMRNPRLHASATARRQLAAGEVDSRLLTTLATLAALHLIDVASFSGSGSQASAGVPLRAADISGAAGAAGTPSAASLSSLRAFLLAQRAPYLPAEMNTVRLATGQAVLHVEFTAPSPLGLLGPAS